DREPEQEHEHHRVSNLRAPTKQAVAGNALPHEPAQRERAAQEDRQQEDHRRHDVAQHRAVRRVLEQIHGRGRDYSEPESPGSTGGSPPAPSSASAGVRADSARPHTTSKTARTSSARSTGESAGSTPPSGRGFE